MTRSIPDVVLSREFTEEVRVALGIQTRVVFTATSRQCGKTFAAEEFLKEKIKTAIDAAFTALKPNDEGFV